MNPPSRRLDALIVTDLHYTRRAPDPQSEGRERWLGPVLLRKAWDHLCQLGRQPDLIILLGDLIEDGAAPGAREDLADLAALAGELPAPVLAVPGNHERDPALVADAFACRPGLFAIGGYGFIVFHDHGPWDQPARRAEEALGWPAEMRRRNPDRPLIALQHHPIWPTIASDYPYMPANVAAIRDSYEAAGLHLSLSGHFHAGQPLLEHHGVQYATVPAAAEAPYRFAHLHLEDERITLANHQLALTRDDLADIHCHTQYAYCASTVNADDNLRLARTFGIGCQGLVEHAFHLYWDLDTAWEWQWQHQEDIVRKAWDGPRPRMTEYRRFIAPYRSRYAPIGLELDVLADGRLCLAPEDREGWDYFLGAVHQVAGYDPHRHGQAEAERLFMRDVERLLAGGIDVLAHPFRWFREPLTRPTQLYDEVAAMLAAAGVAAELNIHCNQPDPAFFAACLAHGVPIALGSDAHDLREVAFFAPHLRLLRGLGLDDAAIGAALYRPAHYPPAVAMPDAAG